MKLLDVVYLSRPYKGIHQGECGCIVEDFGTAAEVEFVDPDTGQTWLIETIEKDALTLKKPAMMRIGPVAQRSKLWIESEACKMYHALKSKIDLPEGEE